MFSKNMYLWFAELNLKVKLAGKRGIEPRNSGLEADVLPLHHSPIFYLVKNWLQR